MQGLNHLFPVGDCPGLDTLGDKFVDEPARVVFGFVRCLQPPADAAGLGEVCMRRLVGARPLRIIRPGPPFTPVVQVSENIKILLPPRGAGIVGLAPVQLRARDHEVQFMMRGVGMPHPQDIILIRLQSGEGHGFKAVHELVFHLRRDVFARRPGEHAGSELPDALLRVDELLCGLGIPSQHGWGRFFPPRIIHPQQVVHRTAPRAFSMRKHLHIHGYFRSSRRIASSRMTTWIVSSPFL